mgnify:CR=1 FL=1
MQILITHGSMARTRVLSLNRWQLLCVLTGLALVLLLLSGTIYHVVFLKAARDVAEARDHVGRQVAAVRTRVGERLVLLVELLRRAERAAGREPEAGVGVPL